MKIKKTAAVLLSALLLAGCKGAETADIPQPADTAESVDFTTTTEAPAASETTATTTTTATDPVPEPVEDISGENTQTDEPAETTDISREAGSSAAGISAETADDTAVTTMEPPVITTTAAATTTTAAVTTAAPVTTTTAVAATTTATAAATTTAAPVTTAARTTTAAAPEVTTAADTTAEAPQTQVSAAEQAAPAGSDSGRLKAYADALGYIADGVDDALDDAVFAANTGEYPESIQGFGQTSALLDGLNGSYYTSDPGVPPEFTEKHAAFASAAGELKTACDEAAEALKLLSSAATGLEVYFGYDSPIDDAVVRISDAASDVDTEDEAYEEAVSGYADRVDDIVSSLREAELSIPDSADEVRMVLSDWQRAAADLHYLSPPSGFESLHSALCGYIDSAVKYLTDFSNAVTRYLGGFSDKADDLRDRFKAAYEDIASEIEG